MPDPREPLGRLVHETRLAHEAEQAAAEGRARFHLGLWEDRSEAQRELDMRIGGAIADYSPHMTDAECDRMLQMVAKYERAAKDVERALDFAGTATRTVEQLEIVVAARDALKVLEGAEEEARDAR